MNNNRDLNPVYSSSAAVTATTSSYMNRKKFDLQLKQRLRAAEASPKRPAAESTAHKEQRDSLMESYEYDKDADFFGIKVKAKPQTDGILKMPYAAMGAQDRVKSGISETYSDKSSVSNEFDSGDEKCSVTLPCKRYQSLDLTKSVKLASEKPAEFELVKTHKSILRSPVKNSPVADLIH